MKEQVKKETLEKIQKYQESLEMLDLLPDDPFDFLVYINIQLDVIHVSIPYDLTSLRVYRRAMGTGWQCNSWSDTYHSCDNTISRCRRYWPRGKDQFDGPSILLTLSTGLDGSSCRVVEAGVEECTIYKVICGGAKCLTI